MYLIWLGLRAEGWKLMRTMDGLRISGRLCLKYLRMKQRKRNLALHYTINVEHENILTDTTKVKEIFVNILSNAVKYTPAGGSVMVDIDELPCEEPGYMIVRTRVSEYRNWYEPGLSDKDFRRIHT